MTTQQVDVMLRSANVARQFTAASHTDAAWNEVTSKTGAISLGDCMKGVTLTHFRAEYAAAIGMIRIYNTNTKKVKVLGMMDPVGESKERKLSNPVTVEENDILQLYTDVA